MSNIEYAKIHPGYLTPGEFTIHGRFVIIGGWRVNYTRTFEQWKFLADGI